MEDAIDDWLLMQINWLRREDVIAEGIRWVKDVRILNYYIFLLYIIHTFFNYVTVHSTMIGITTLHILNATKWLVRRCDWGLDIHSFTLVIPKRFLHFDP